jgi:radical SAM superfamily enzyme YgiQ (UPF0313 family)
MKILLIDPPFEVFQGIKRGFFPLGAVCLATVAKQQGHEAAVFDGEKGEEVKVVNYLSAKQCYQKYLEALDNPDHPVWKTIESTIRRQNPQLLGISCSTVKFDSAVRIAEIAKKIDPELPIVLGGVHPTLIPEQSLKPGLIDYVIRGEGERTFVELIDALSDKGTCDEIKGLSYLKQGKVIHNPPREFIENLDTLPLLNRDLLINASQYDSEDLGLMMGSRGCPFECTYCASNKVWTRRVRYRSADNILAEMKMVHRKYGTTQFSFEDDSFTSNKKLIGEFCRKKNEARFDVKWSAITRINLLTDELLKTMKEAGLNHIRVGIESGSDKILKETKKGMTVEDYKKGARLIRKHKIYWSAYFMLGLPTETREDILATIDLMKEIQPNYCTVSIFTPYPGTEIFEDLLKEGKVSLDMNWSRFSHASPHNYFAKYLNREEFAEIVDYATSEFDRYNGSFRRLFKRAQSKASIYLNHPGDFFKDIQRYLQWRQTANKNSKSTVVN